tara:strand:+ start:149 stop:853 length:705 start_codon:yes stop_codon:yes gene_type:complete
MALKIRILIIATISIIIASIAGIQSIEVSTNEAYAIKAESTIPSWVKELAQSWIIDEATTSEYLGSLEWLIDEGIMSVDTASAKPSSDIDGVIADLEALEKGLDKLEDKIYEFETVIMVDKSCRGSNGWCPGSVPPFVSTFYIREDLSKVDSIIVNVHATSIAYPSCQLAGFAPGEISTDRFGITCDSHPGEGAVLVYTMLKNPSGDGALLEGIDRAGPLVEAPEDERLDRAGP